MALDVDTVSKMMNDKKSAAEIAAAGGVSKNSVLRFVKKHGLGPWPLGNHSTPRPMPDDFVSLAPTMFRDDAIKHWRCSTVTIGRWYKEAGVKPFMGRRAKVSRETLRAKVDAMPIGKIAEDLGVSRGTVTRMMRKAGIERKTPVAPPKPTSYAIKKPMGSPLAPTNHYQRDMTPEGLAADCLQRDRWTVFRCNEDGKPSVGGKHWIVGKAGPIDKAELFERADRAARRMGEPAIWRSAY